MQLLKYNGIYWIDKKFETALLGCGLLVIKQGPRVTTPPRQGVL